MNLTDYLERIGYKGTLEANRDTLFALHRAHLYAISYENLDIHLGRTLSLDETQIFDKLVTQRRGGWCYEMNTLFAWALREVGFSVTLLASAVNRAVDGDKAEKKHLILLVRLDRPYLVDVGFGNGILEPLPLEAGTYQQGFLSYQLTREGDHWYFHNQPYGGPGFDFTLEPHQLMDFSEKCTYLQTSPESNFVRVSVCHRMTPKGIVSLRGAVLTKILQDGAQEQMIDNQQVYESVLREQFDLHLPDDDVSRLWQKVWERHQVWLSERRKHQ